VLATGGVRSGGQELTIQAVQAAMLVHDMVIVSDGLDTSHFGGTLWNAGDKGLVNDDFGLKTARNLGKRIGEVCARMARGKAK
jgi:multimeric flavodoxin WrbA